MTYIVTNYLTGKFIAHYAAYIDAITRAKATGTKCQIRTSYNTFVCTVTREGSIVK